MFRVDPGAPLLELEPASVSRRFAAFCYDLLLLGAVLFCYTLLLLLLRGGREVAPGSIWFEFSLVAIAAAFFCGFWTHGGQTLGMRAWRIRVVQSDGSALDWSRAALRFFASMLAALPAGLGLWWAAFDAHGRGWHDHWAGTRVVRAAPTTSPSAPAP